jgi:OOP family OmpA-OmpF porin
MFKKKYVLPLALLACGAANASTEAENPWYAGARLGGTHYNDFSGISADDKNDVAGGAFLGYKLSPALAVETGYTYLGESKFSTAGIEQEAIDLVGKYTWKTSDSLSIFAKAGAFYYFTGGQDALSAYDDQGSSATAGLGLEYMFTKNLSARLEYQYYHELKLDDAPIDIEWDTHFYGLGLVYSWGGSKPVAKVKQSAPVIKEPAIIEKQPAVKPQPIIEKQPVVEAQPVIEEQPVVEPQPEIINSTVEIAPLTIELPFMFDSDQLPEEYLQQLTPIAQHLIDYPQAKLFVVGHTDSRGSEAYNQKLSEQRAALIGDYLATEFAINKSRIVEEGHGELEPRATNDTEAGRALNRRVSVFTPGLTVKNK